MIVDATFPTAELRTAFFRDAADIGSKCLLVEMQCPEEVVRARMLKRAHDRHEVSDANWHAYLQAKPRFEPTGHLDAAHRCVLDSRWPAERMTREVLDRPISLQ